MASAARPALLPQLASPVVALAQAADGDHSLTLTVSPENLGPVTVRAHIGAGGIHIELLAPGDLGRDALRAILADLRRDLAAAAPQATLTLSNSDSPESSAAQQNASSSGQAPGGGPGAGRPPADSRPAAGLPRTPEETQQPPPPPLLPPHGGIDVYA